MPSIVTYPEILQHALNDVTDQYRPRKFRAVLGEQVSHEVPFWAQEVAHQTISESAELQPVPQGGIGMDLPQAQVNMIRETLPMLKFGGGVSWADDEIVSGEKTGIRLDVARANASARKSEQILDAIAAGTEVFAGLTMPGLGTVPGSGTATASTKAAGGTTWAVATFEELLDDLHTVANSIDENSKEVYQCSKIVLPQAQYNIVMSKHFGVDSKETVLQVFLQQRPEIEVFKWNPFATLGAGSTPCALAWDASDPDVAKMLISREYSPDQPRRMSGGWVVDYFMKTGGVLSRSPLGISKMSGL